MHAICIWYRGDVTADEILDSAIHAKPKIACLGHDLELVRKRMKVEKFPIWDEK
jgi:hypothetical protein